MAEGLGRRPQDGLRIFEEGFRSNPRFFNPEDIVRADPIEDMFMSSSALDALRRALPSNVGSTAWGNDFQRRMETAPNWQRKIANAISSVPLGGMSEVQKEEYRVQRDLDPRIARETVDPGYTVTKTSRFGLPQVAEDAVPSDRTKLGRRARMLQASGIAAGDIMTDGLRTIWWFLNAPQAVATLGSLQGMHMGEKPLTDMMPDIPVGKEKTIKSRLLPTRGYRLAATMPAVIGTSIAVGNIGRQPGYKAIIPSEDDPRKSDAPAAELLSRYFLGRSGRLLPYSEFAKERPDVSPEEYRRYKAYTFDQKTDLNPFDGDFNLLGALKGTVDGIQGPEVNFMGKSIPIATGVLPAVAAAVGTGYGLRRGGKRLLAPRGGITKQQGVQSRLAAKEEEFDKLAYKLGQYKPEDKYFEGAKGKADLRRKARLQENIPEMKAINEARKAANEREAFLSAVQYGSGGLVSTAVLGQALESLRRSLKTPEEENV
ncbi:MAG: hypothetical protein CMB76_05725 [Euryarchaeota archaeon]|nr:hypothetical protein [Euryarchaeota archaeon]